MVNPLIIAGCLAVRLGGVVFLFVGGESRAEKRRAAVNRGSPKAIAASSRSDDAQEADRRRPARPREGDASANNLQARIDQSGLSISRRRFIAACVVFGLLLGAAAWVQIEQRAARGDGRRDRLRRFAAPPASNGFAGGGSSKFIANFPNAIDIIVRGVKSGLPLGDTIRIAAKESAEPVRVRIASRVVEFVVARADAAPKPSSGWPSGFRSRKRTSSRS